MGEKSKCEQMEILKDLRKQKKKTELETEFKDQLPADYSTMEDKAKWQALRKLQVAQKKAELEKEFSETNADPELRLPADYKSMEEKSQWKVLRSLQKLQKFKKTVAEFREKKTLPILGYSQCSDEGQWMELLHLVWNSSLKPTLVTAFKAEITEKFPDFSTMEEKKQAGILGKIAEMKL